MPAKPTAEKPHRAFKNNTPLCPFHFKITPPASSSISDILQAHELLCELLQKKDPYNTLMVTDRLDDDHALNGCSPSTEHFEEGLIRLFADKRINVAKRTVMLWAAGGERLARILSSITRVLEELSGDGIKRSLVVSVPIQPQSINERFFPTSLSEDVRLSALQALAEHGIRSRVIIDPIVPTHGAFSEYMNLVDKINAIGTERLTFGFLRHQYRFRTRPEKGTPDLVREYCTPTNILGWWVVPEQTRLAALMRLIPTEDRGANIRSVGLCCETPKVFAALPRVQIGMCHCTATFTAIRHKIIEE